MLLRIQRYNSINILKFKTPQSDILKPYAPQHVENHLKISLRIIIRPLS